MEKRMHIPTQNEAIIEYLHKHESITAMDAVKELGCMRLSARIDDLKRRGYKFINEPITVINRYGQKCRVMSYALEGEPDE